MIGTLPSKLNAGLTSSDLRWLIAKGYVEHACEIDAVTNDIRSFKDNHRFRFTADSCFVLTNLGVQFLRTDVLEPIRAAGPQGINPINPPPADAVA